MAKRKHIAEEMEDQGFTGSENTDTSVNGNREESCGSDNMADVANGGDNTSDAGGSQINSAEEWKDKYMRLSAEFDNYRKRTLKEKMDLVASGGRDVVADMLPVLDDIDRALEAAQCTDDIESVRTGQELIAHKLKGLLAGKGLKEIDAVGLELDTDFHDAVAKSPAQEQCGKGRIIDVVQKGYTFKDSVIRHAKVVVGE